MLRLLSANLDCLRARIHWYPWCRDGFVNQDEKDGKPFHLEIRMSSRQRPLVASHAHQAHCIHWDPWYRDEHVVPGGKGDKGTWFQTIPPQPPLLFVVPSQLPWL